MPLLHLVDAKDHLNIADTDQGDDHELAATIAAVEQYVEQFTGPIDNVTVTEVHRLGTTARTGLLVRTRPVVSVTSVTVDALPVDVGSIDVDPLTGAVTARAGAPFTGRAVIEYIAGSAGVPPPAAVQAAKLILEHQWAPQRRGAMRGRFTQEEDAVTVPGLTYAFPRAAVQMLEGLPHRFDQPTSAF